MKTRYAPQRTEGKPELSVKYRNAEAAFISKLQELRSMGHEVRVRGNLTRELNHQTVMLAFPLERCIVVPHRRNNVFATIAETVWVIAGRNDVAYLTDYLPRAIDFSDDGTTWRAGYGPRLRSWGGVDQIAAVRRLLLSAPESRRAVMSIFDPASDFESSKDIPCTNWLHFTLRNGVLDLNVAVRSNDLIWGFSGINTFEWSVLQEMMAFWLGASVGQANYFISSLHIYERHFARADKMLAADARRSSYKEAPAKVRFATKFEDFDGVLEQWFQLEGRIRTGTCPSSEIEAFPDPLLRDFLWMLAAYWAQTTAQPNADQLLLRVEDRALAFAGAQHFLGEPVPEAKARTRTVDDALTEEIVDYLSGLHRIKDAMYGSSWKRRGEQISIMANVARKVDRLVMFDGGATSADESVHDTVADLLIYALKYVAYLNDVTNISTPEHYGSWSDGVGGFEQLLLNLPRQLTTASMSDAIAAAVEAFETVERSLESGQAVEERIGKVRELALRSWLLLLALAAEAPTAMRDIMRPYSDAPPSPPGTRATSKGIN
jgi:thymidylate synthase